MSFLRSVRFRFPEKDIDFGRHLFGLLSTFGEIEADTLTFKKSDANFLPTLSFELSSTQVPSVSFDVFPATLGVELVNKTSQERKSPEVYTPIAIEDLTSRLNGLDFDHLDHLGFNLPWFDGIHPEILQLRKDLAAHAAYYRFPTGEDWDFIIPASETEMSQGSIDLSKVRYPKLEIVSFEKCSIPLIQIDFTVQQKFEEIRELFPEGIPDPEIKNVWVYLESPYGLDICFVIGENYNDDWSSFFEGHRLYGSRPEALR